MAAKKSAKKNAAKRSETPKKPKAGSAEKGKGLQPQKSASGGKREVVKTMPSVIMGKQPTGKQLKREENLVLDEEDDQLISADEARMKKLSEETVNRLGKAELRAIATSRGYWKSTDGENRSGSRTTRAAFMEAQKSDKSLKGEI